MYERSSQEIVPSSYLLDGEVSRDENESLSENVSPNFGVSCDKTPSGESISFEANQRRLRRVLLVIPLLRIESL